MMLRDRLFLASRQSGTELTLLLPHDIGNWISLCQVRRYVKALPQSLVSLIYHLVVRPFPWILTAKKILLLSFSLNSLIENLLSSPLEIVFSTLLSRRSLSVPQITSFISFLDDVSWV
jgi:hypothetical protein